MQVLVDFDDDLIKSYVERGSRPLFTIYCQQGGVAYPEQGWVDFGTVILGWWLVAAKTLLEGAEETSLPFMDGPYGLTVHRQGDRLTITSADTPVMWRIPLHRFVSEVLQAVRRVQQKFDALGIADTDGLEVGVEQVGRAMSRAQRPAPSRTPVQVEQVF